VVLVPDVVMQKPVVVIDVQWLDFSFQQLVPVAVEVTRAGCGAVLLPVAETNPAKVKLAFGALDMIASIRLLNCLFTVWARSGVADQPLKVWLSSFDPFSVSGIFFASSQPLLPDGAG